MHSYPRHAPTLPTRGCKWEAPKKKKKKTVWLLHHPRFQSSIPRSQNHDGLFLIVVIVQLWSTGRAARTRSLCACSSAGGRARAAWARVPMGSPSWAAPSRWARARSRHSAGQPSATPSERPAARKPWPRRQRPPRRPVPSRPSYPRLRHRRPGRSE
ncbi:hypothetical protein T492DRAFT_116880 [Pavlovales sp. CCMP2436]|nr:hypothetical protein T492DRAFT_116880 [Pavlovales sp. CCMP2436]